MNQSILFILRFLPCLLAGLIGSTVSGRADVLLENAFDGPDGPLIDLPGWYMGVSSVGDVTRSEKNLYVKNNALVWEGSPDVTNAVFCRRLMISGKNAPSIIFAGFVLTVETPPLRGKFADTNNLGTTFFAFSNATGSSQRGHLGVVYGDVAGHFRLSLGGNGNIKNSDVIPYSFPAGEQVRVVLAYNFGHQVTSMWVNPSGRVDEPSLHSIGIDKPVVMNAIMLRMRNHSKQDLGSFRVSRLVVATTFAEAMPSP